MKDVYIITWENIDDPAFDIIAEGLKAQQVQSLCSSAENTLGFTNRLEAVIFASNCSIENICVEMENPDNTTTFFYDGVEADTMDMLKACPPANIMFSDISTQWDRLNEKEARRLEDELRKQLKPFIDMYIDGMVTCEDLFNHLKART